MKRILSLILCLVLCLTLLPASALAEDIVIVDVSEPEDVLIETDEARAEPADAAPNGDVAINEKNFPDKTFRSSVKAYFDTDGNGKLSPAEISEAQYLTFGPDGKEVTNLKGIELLPELIDIYASEAQITSIDLSGNTKLESLSLDYCAQLTTLDVSMLPALTSLRCGYCKLSSLDVSKNTELAYLTCGGNQFGTLDLSKNTKLKGLYFGGKNVKTLDISKNTELETLYIDNSQLTSLDLSKHTKLMNLSCTGVPLKTLDISACPGLVEIVNNGDYGHDPDDKYTYRMYNGRELNYNNGLTLYVDPKATISKQPKSVSVEDGVTVKFRVTAESSLGSGYLSYQWFYRKSASGSWAKTTLTGATTATLTVPATEARNGYQYRCKIVNFRSAPVYTKAATLTVNVTQAPVISTQPKDVSKTPGETATFTVKSPNSGLTYQWQYRKSASGSWAKTTLDGATTATLTVPAATKRDGYQYRCAVKNKIGTTYSDAATLRVGNPPVVTAQPQDAACGDGKWVHFSVEAEGEGLSYQWQYCNSGSSVWYNCTASSGKTARLTVKANYEIDGRQYRCKVRNEYGTTISKTARLSCLWPPVIDMQSDSSVTVKLGNSAMLFAEADGDQLSYQWYYRTSENGYWHKSTVRGANEHMLIFPVKTYHNGYQYKCRISNPAGYVYSDIITLTVVKD